ncbi:unnamed protein product [Linum tenue]|uniref:Uncharacterized protein n=1 Tax=Linum tenue TaxID=586396 RepID=A0AAV0LTI2_9ROSI|nr:unnamed protein product [Linum tenue]
MRIDKLEQRLKAHVIGQDEAINQVGQAIRRSQTGARNPNRPLASFLFDGASGVGKTKLAQAVAIEFYGYQGVSSSCRHGRVHGGKTISLPFHRSN